MEAGMRSGIHLRRDQPNDERHEVQGVEQDCHSLVPPQHDQHRVDPVWDVRNA